MNKSDYSVKEITRKEAGNYFLHGHYLKKWPRISFLFGLFLNGTMVGAVSYGTPSSPAARASVAGHGCSSMVLELNRLFLENNLKNEASFLISRSIKLLPKPRIIISYADNDQGHEGTIYKAANFRKGGKSEGYHYDWVVKGKEHLHQSTLFREFRHSKTKLEDMKAKYGDLLTRKKRSPKSRFFLVHADKKAKRRIEFDIRWREE